ncbi:MAG: Fe-S protein assembly co-chaperone HscB [Pseudomonadota bacterium]
MIPYFEIFSITPTFDIDQAQLEAEYFKAQRLFHPDRFVGKSVEERNQALQKSMDINKAYEILKNPLKRAQYILHLQGIEVGGEHDSIKPSKELLVEIMELREHLAESTETERIRELHKNSLLEISKFYAKNNWQKMAQETMRLGYLVKMLDENKMKNL